MKVRFAISAGLGSPDTALLTTVATESEKRGFDGLWFSDVPMLPATDPLLAVAFMSATTSRVKLGVNLVPFGYEPFVFARQVAQLDQLSAGRLLVTIVPGLDQPGERAALGVGARDRGALLDTTLPLLKAWWSGESVAPSVDSEPVVLPVRPRQDPLEVWLGGTGPKAIRRAGRLADGWLGSLVTPEQAGSIRAAIQREADAAGRAIDPEHFGLSIPYARSADQLERAIRPGRAQDQSLVPVGAAALRQLIGALTDQGLSKFVVRAVGPVESWPDELDWLGDAVLDLQS